MKILKFRGYVQAEVDELPNCHNLLFGAVDDVELPDRITSTSDTQMFVALFKNAQVLRWRIRVSLVLHCNYCS